MSHECIELKQEVLELNEVIEKTENFLNEHKSKIDNDKQIKHLIWSLKYHHSRLQERHDISINNRDREIYYLKDKITELESELYKIKGETNIEKVDIHLKFDNLTKTRPLITLSSNSKKHDSRFDEFGRKLFIPKLKDDSYIKIRFIGKDGKKLDYRNDDEPTSIHGISSSSAIIGNTMFVRGSFKEIRDNCILNKRVISLLLMHSSVYMYTLNGTENIEIIESSEDINATLEII